MDIMTLIGYLIGIVSIITAIVLHRRDQKKITQLQRSLKKHQTRLTEKASEIDKSLKRNERNKDIDFFKVEPEETNDAFYDHFGNKIRAAKKNIFLTGRGITKLEKENYYLVAKEYTENFIIALEKHSLLSVTRVQFSDRACPTWYELWYKVWQVAPDRVKFFILDTNEVITADESPWHDMVHVASIDFHNSEKCVAEFMIPIHKDEPGEGSIEIAGSALFMERNPLLCESIKRRIFFLTMTKQCRKIDNEEKWLNEIEKAKDQHDIQ